MSFTNSTKNRKNQDVDYNKTIFQPDKRINKTPPDSMDTENESPPHKSTKRILKHLESSLSPKYIEFNESTGAQRSRYGREHKYKETDGFLPTEVVYAYQRVGKAVSKSEIKQNTNLIMIKPLGKHTTTDDNYYESPIEKLISKNKKLILGSSAEFATTSDLFEKTKKRLFTSLTDDSGDLVLSPQNLHSSTPNAILDIDKPKAKLIENMSLITNPVETSTPKNVEKITNPVRILQKGENPSILQSLKKKLASSRKLPISSAIHNGNEESQVNLNQMNITHAVAQEFPTINSIKKEKVDNPSNIENSKPILKGTQSNDNLIEMSVKDRCESISLITPTKRQESPFKNIKYKLSLTVPNNVAKKVETTGNNIEIDRPVEKSIEIIPKTTIKMEKANNTLTTNESDVIHLNSLKAGDVLWARLSSYPYWPCLVVPNDENCIIQEAFVKKVHVKFFADNGRRCWVAFSSIIPYKGLDDFYARKAADEKIAYPKKYKQKVLKPFTIPSFQMAKWEASVKEADEIYAQPIEKRLNCFETILETNRAMKKQLASIMRQQRKSILQKRPRSPTPECPPYELIGFTPKKIKMESTTPSDLATILNLASDIGKDVALSFLMNDTGNLSLPGAEKFYETFDKRFLSNADDLLINKSHLEDFTKKLWNLKNNNLNNNIIKIEIKDEQLSENSITDDGGSAVGITSLRSSISTGPTTSIPNTNMTEFSKNYLFRKLSREFVCRICFKTKNLLKCEGACNGWYHKACLNSTEIDTNPDDPPVESRKLKRKQIGSDIEPSVSPPQEFLCNDCKNKLSPACFVCKKYDDESTERRLKCKNHSCGRFYHIRCLKYFPQAKTVDGILICPAHSCHTCISDDPKGKYLSDRTSYVKCVICPASYHMDSTCIPAGTEFITAIQIICPKHREYSKQQNCNWCFICATGGNLVCCETCPTAFHPECLKIPLDEKGYICEECETGRMPLYGEIVWAKLGRYRWWPAQIIPPPAVPDTLSRVSRKKADFCVKFFGSNNYAWINRGRVYLYQEGDWGKTKNIRGIEKQYENALIEAKTMYELLNQQKLMRKDEKNDRLRPLPYIKIKTNKVVAPVRLIEDDINDMNPCICDPKDDDPCGPYSGCLNRLLMFECHPSVCPARERCMNQMFEKRIYPNLQVKRTELRGWGLVTLENLKAGAFIVEYVGEVIDNDEFMRRVKKMQETKDENYYFLTMIKDLMIDAGPKGNVARFMNHSCEPNCETQKWTVNGITRVGLFALVDIPANTELTFNYNLECIGNVKKACYCGASKCSGFIGEKSRSSQAKKIKTRTSSITKKKDRK